MMLRWFRFSATEGDWYGYGTEAEADEYAQEFASDYSAVPPNDLLPGTVDAKAFSIREALAFLREGIIRVRVPARPMRR
jgi:hypothetical protein